MVARQTTCNVTPTPMPIPSAPESVPPIALTELEASIEAHDVEDEGPIDDATDDLKVGGALGRLEDTSARLDDDCPMVKLSGKIVGGWVV
jgi:hypothetical protein